MSHQERKQQQEETTPTAAAANKKRINYSRSSCTKKSNVLLTKIPCTWLCTELNLIKLSERGMQGILINLWLWNVLKNSMLIKTLSSVALRQRMHRRLNIGIESQNGGLKRCFLDSARMKVKFPAKWCFHV